MSGKCIHSLLCIFILKQNKLVSTFYYNFLGGAETHQIVFNIMLTGMASAIYLHKLRNDLGKAFSIFVRAFTY